MKQGKKLAIGDRTVGYLFLLPSLLFMLAFIVYPIFYNIMVSLQEVNSQTLMAEQRKFVGLANYISVLKGNYLGNAMKNTLVFTVGCIVLQFTLGFAAALLYTRKAKRLKPISGILLSTYIMPPTIVAIVFKFFFQSSGGFINGVLRSAGLIAENIDWLIDGDMAMLSVIFTNTWTGIAFNMILLMSGLTGIPGDIYESAVIDGASGFKQFFKITLPLMKNTILTVLVLGFVYTFKCFELIYVMTGGGPNQATELLSIYSYRRSFTEFQYGEAAAIANVLFLCLFLVGLFYAFLIKKKEEY